VVGLCHYEASAYAAWAGQSDTALAGAVLPHEYQWEIAARLEAIKTLGQIQEWCSNPFHAYPEFAPFPDADISQVAFDGTHVSLRGASLHSPRPLHRISCRDRRPPDQGFGFSGLRLVLPPSR
jgi:iron(II)-dependent oxidoreductase